MRRAFKRWCKRAKIPYGYSIPGGVVIHTLRHSAASFLANAGEPLNVVKAVTRHSTTQMVMYSHATIVAVGKAASRLSEITKQHIPCASPTDHENHLSHAQEEGDKAG